MRKVVRKTRRNILQSLIKQLKKIEASKRCKDKDPKIVRTIALKLEEMTCLKRVNVDEVSKKSLLGTSDWKQVINSPSSTPEQKVFAKLASHDWVEKSVKQFKQENPNCDLWLPTLIELWQEKREIKRKKIADKKSRNIQDKKVEVKQNDDDVEIDDDNDGDDDDDNDNDDDDDEHVSEPLEQESGKKTNEKAKQQTDKTKQTEKAKQQTPKSKTPKENNIKKTPMVDNKKSNSTNSTLPSSKKKPKNKEVAIKRINTEELKSSKIISLQNESSDEEEAEEAEENIKKEEKQVVKSPQVKLAEDEEQDAFFLSGNHKQKREKVEERNSTPQYVPRRSERMSARSDSKSMNRSGAFKTSMRETASAKKNFTPTIAEKESLHPSWEARKKLKEQQSITFSTSNKKIKFDS